MIHIEYIIVGDVKKHNNTTNDFAYDEEETSSCLVLVCGKSLKGAKESLHRMINNPTENDKRLSAGLTNLKIKEVKDEDCWWNFYCD